MAEEFTMSVHVDRKSVLSCGESRSRCGESPDFVAITHRHRSESIARDARPKSRVFTRVETPTPSSPTPPNMSCFLSRSTRVGTDGAHRTL